MRCLLSCSIKACELRLIGGDTAPSGLGTGIARGSVPGAKREL